MYTLFSNEKLGMPVEQVRLAEIRRQIEAQRLRDQMRPKRQFRIAEFVQRALGRLKISSRGVSTIEAQVDRSALG